jgi:hypothetical protein
LVVDIAVMQIDFSNYVNAIPSLKTHLDKLNKLDKIVTFAPSISSINDLYKQEIFIGGYADTNIKPGEVFTQ